MSNLLVTKQQNEVTIFSDGSTTISQRKLARLLGVNEGSLTKHVSRLKQNSGLHQNANTTNGLDENMAFLVVTHYAYVSTASTQEAKDFLHKLGTGGMRAYNYHEAGYVIQAVPVQPKSPIELAKENVAQAQHMLALIENQEKLKQEVVMQQMIIDKKLIVTNENPNYKTVATVRKLDPDGIYDGNLLTRKRVEMKLPHSQLYAPDGYPTVNTYHLNVWNAVYPHLDLQAVVD
jgi:hypothetical protein